MVLEVFVVRQYEISLSCGCLTGEQTSGGLAILKLMAHKGEVRRQHKQITG